MPHRLSPFTKFTVTCFALVAMALSYAVWPDGSIDTKSGITIQTNIIRGVVVFFGFLITVEFGLIRKIIATERFNKLIDRLFITFLVFTILRVASAFIDWQLALSIGWASALVNCGFFAYVWMLVRKQRHLIEWSEFNSEGQRRISALADDVLGELEDISFRLQTLKG